MPNKISDTQKQQALELMAKGLTRKEVSAVTGLSITTLRYLWDPAARARDLANAAPRYNAMFPRRAKEYIHKAAEILGIDKELLYKQTELLVRLSRESPKSNLLHSNQHL